MYVQKLRPLFRAGILSLASRQVLIVGFDRAHRDLPLIHNTNLNPILCNSFTITKTSSGSSDSGTSDGGAKSTDKGRLVLLVVLAFLLPPAAVGLKDGITANFWINVCLSIFLWIPGIIHALWIVLKD